MSHASVRLAALLTAIVAGAALAFALALEHWGGMVPCALCLLERWPYRITIVLGLLAVIMPVRIAPYLLGIAGLVLLFDAGLGFVHFGVEQHWWPSPLPECAAPHFTAGTIAERLASMPAHPAKPCDAPSYLIPGVPLSLAASNALFALVFAAALTMFLRRSARRRR
jgi:disulfide bond formation protein DsbB